MPDDNRIRLGLRERLGDRVAWDERTLRRQARDQSIYEVSPVAVVFPRDVDDVVTVLSLAAECGVPVTPRGGGSGTAGAALGSGVVLAPAKDGPLGQLGSLTSVSGRPEISAGPAVLHDALQAALRTEGLFLPADPSSGALCLIGGNVATKASGPHELKHGSIDQYLASLEIVLADGTVVDTSRPESIPARLASGLDRLVTRLNASVPLTRRLQARRGRKIASGYNLFPLLGAEDPVACLCPLLAGSVGTLGIVTQARLRAEPRPADRVLLRVFFDSLEEAGTAVAGMRAAGAAAIEIVNERTVSLAARHRGEALSPGGRCHLLLAEFVGPGAADEATAAVAALPKGPHPPALATDPAEMERLWAVRKALLPMLRAGSGGGRALSVVNDVGVPPEALAPFIREIEAAFDRLGLEAAIYGHAGSGNLHLRPFFTASPRDLPLQIERVARTVYEIAFTHDGTITAEHGMGPLRAPFLEAEWGAEAVSVMRGIKDLFDPEGRLNPGAMFPLHPLTARLREDLLPTCR